MAHWVNISICPNQRIYIHREDKAHHPPPLSVIERTFRTAELLSAVLGTTVLWVPFSKDIYSLVLTSYLPVGSAGQEGEQHGCHQ